MIGILIVCANLTGAHMPVQQRIVAKKDTDYPKLCALSPSGKALYWVEDRGLRNRIEKSIRGGKHDVRDTMPRSNSLILNALFEKERSREQVLPPDIALPMQHYGELQLQATKFGVCVGAYDTVVRYDEHLQLKKAFKLDFSALGDMPDEELISGDGKTVWVIGTAKGRGPTMWSPSRKVICITFHLDGQARKIAGGSVPRDQPRVGHGSDHGQHGQMQRWTGRLHRHSNLRAQAVLRRTSENCGALSGARSVGARFGYSGPRRS